MIHFDQGQLRFVRRGAVPIGVHWSLLLGLAAFSRFTFNPWFILGFLTLVGVHELGHAFLVKRYGLQVEGIVFHGLGGECSFSGRVTQRKRSVIAWGGVAAQALMLIASLVWFTLSPPASEGAIVLQHALVTTNLWMIGLNLLPLPGFDGHYAWRVLKGKTASGVQRSRPPRRPTPGTVGSKSGRKNDEHSNVIAFPSERAGSARSTEAREPGKTGNAVRDINAQLLAITDRVNAPERPETPKRDGDGDSDSDGDSNGDS